MTSVVVTGIVLGLFVAAAVFLFVRGLGGLLRLKWKGALGMLGGIGLLLFTLVLIFWFSNSIGMSTEGVPLSPTTLDNIAIKNYEWIGSISALGLPLGLLAGAIAALADRRRDRAKAGR